MDKKTNRKDAIFSVKTATEMMEKPLNRISANEYAREKLHLLERVQGHATWHTSIVAESQEDIVLLQQLQQELAKGHYTTMMAVDAWNRPVLEIEHIGNQSGLVKSFEKLGAMKGLQITTEKLQDGVGDALNGTKDFFDAPVKFLSGFYLLADALLFASGFIEKDASGEKVDGAAKWLKSSAGVFSAIQSFVFLHYGEDANKHQLANIERHVNHALQNGENPLGFLQDDSQLSNHTHPLAAALLDNPVARFVTDNPVLREHPITAGAVSWIMGQSALFASAMMRLNQIRNSGVDLNSDEAKDAMKSIIADAGRAVTSIIGWSILTMDQKHTEEKTPFTQNPLKSVQEHVQEAPQVFSGLIALAASVIGMGGGNPLMQAAEVSNITGDMAMFFTKKSEYGGESFGDPKVLAEALAGFLERSPILLSPATEKELVAEMANYFTGKTVAQAQLKGTPLAEDFAASLYNDTISELAGKPRGIDKVAFHIAEIVALFPEEQQQPLRQQLVQTISGFRAVMVEPQELEAFAKEAQAGIVLPQQPYDAPSMTKISDILADLTFALPAMHASEHASRLFDVVQQQVSQTSVAHHKIFEHALTHKAAEDLGISAQELQQMMRKAELVQQEQAVMNR